MDIAGVRSEIDSNTIMIVGSAPDYAFGNFDDIPTLSDMALKYGVGLHVDCCLGSFVVPFIEEAGYKVPYVFDFRLPGVTAMSCDPHKYGYGPKGYSVLLFSKKEIRKAGLFAVSDWSGGFYATPSLAGSRSGAVIAATWASLMKQGKKGFAQKAKELLDAVAYLKKQLSQVKGIKILSRDDVSLAL